MQVLYEDNHLIIVYKEAGEIVQADKSGDIPLSEIVKQWLKAKYNKPGNVFLGVVHRLDRPVSGLVIFAKTSKALTDWLVRNERQNKSYAYNHQVPTSKKSILHYKVINQTDHYTLLEVNLMTGRHHQIRCQLSNMDCPIKGDLKYGAPRSNPDGGISLLSHRVEFVHPVSKETIRVESPLPKDNLWQAIGNI